MKKLLFFCVLTLFLTVVSQGQEKPKRNILGISAGIVPAVKDMYFGEPWDFWPNRELSPIYQFFYARQIHNSIRLGAYLEFENVRFTDQTGINPRSFRRNNAGLNLLGQYPKTPFHLQFGGYLGYGYLRANHWNDLHGLDFGFIAGPAYENEKIGIAAHVHSGYAGYKSSGTPSEVILYTPKILLKVYYKF